MKLIQLNLKLVLCVALVIVATFFLYIPKSSFFSKDNKELKIPDSSTIEKIDLPFQEKSFSLGYNTVVFSSLIENISIFKSTEDWKGSGFYDQKLFFEYPESLSLAGADRNKIVVRKEVKLNLEKITNFDLILNLQTDPDDLETANLIFLDENSNHSNFTLPKLRKGWEFIDMPREKFAAAEKFNWNKISQVQLEFIPRPLGRVVVNLGGLRALVQNPLYQDWNIINKQILILDKREDNISLLVRNVNPVALVTTIKKITNVANFSFQLSLSPLIGAWSGVFFRGNYLNGYGYYLMINGVSRNQWQVYKINKAGFKVLKKGTINNFQFKTEEWYYLKVEAEGDIIKSYFSTDGKEFLPLGTVTDSEFNSGGVGIAIGNGGVYLFNDFVFTRY